MDNAHRPQRGTPSGRSGAGRGGTGRTGTGRTGTGRTGSSAKGGATRGSSPRGGTAKGSTAKGSTAKAGTARGGTAKGGTAKGGTPRSGAPRGATTKAGTAKGGTARGGAAKGRTVNGGSTAVRTGTGRTGTGRTGTGRTGTGRTGTGRTGTGRGRPSGRSGANRRGPRRPLTRLRARAGRAARAGDPNRRLRFALVLVLFVLSLFGGRLVQLQGLDASVLAAQALGQRTADAVLPAQQGSILDASGKVLATTVERRNITVDQRLVPQYRRRAGGQLVASGVNGAAADLSPVLHVPVAELEKRLSGDKSFAYVAKAVTPAIAEKVLRLAVTGIYTEQASRRYYPGGTVAANVLGFVGSDGRAWGGIEQAYATVLSGEPGSLTYERGRDGAVIPTGVVREVPPQNGSSVTLTLNSDLQYQAQQALSAQVKATGSEAGYLVAMTPEGKILALVSVPTFDPNRPAAAKVADRNDRALQDVFEPGSTTKVITLAAAIEEGTTTPHSRVIVPPTLRRAGITFHDAEKHGTEQLTTAGVLAKSSNLGTIKLGEQVPATTLYDYLVKFGIGQSTRLGIAESPGILAPADQWSSPQRYTVMFGQGVSVNALQVASVFATIANDGVRATPQLVAGTTTPDGVFHPAPAADSTRVVSARTAGQLRLMMEGVVGEHGTAVAAQIPGYRVAGKTGTAQAPDEDCGCYRGYTASFIGMAPADDPAVVVAVVLQRPTRGHYGGEVAAPVFQQVTTDALAELKVAPTGTRAPVMPLTW
jgi:cell division protein FtsI (penicillin-binding protein 3)